MCVSPVDGYRAMPQRAGCHLYNITTKATVSADSHRLLPTVTDSKLPTANVQGRAFNGRALGYSSDIRLSAAVMPYRSALNMIHHIMLFLSLLP